jgi:hypothetical protein
MLWHPWSIRWVKENHMPIEMKVPKFQRHVLIIWKKLDIFKKKKIKSLKYGTDSIV